MSATGAFQEYDDERFNDSYVDYVNKLNERRDLFSKTIGRRSVSLLRSVGVGSVERVSYVDSSWMYHLHTTSTSKPVELSESTGLISGRIRVERHRVALLGLITRPTDYLRRTGVGPVTNVAIDFARVENPTNVQSVTINADVFAKSEDMYAGNLRVHYPDARPRMDEFNRVFDIFDAQVQE